MDDAHDRRRVFLRLTERERFEALFDELMKERSERVKLEARMVEVENQNEYLQGEIEGISHRKRETLDVMNTSDKIQAALDKRFAFWRPVLQNAVSFLVVTLEGGLVLLMYMSLTGWKP